VAKYLGLTIGQGMESLEDERQVATSSSPHRRIARALIRMASLTNDLSLAGLA
jgi:hypothetical protein